MLPYTDIINKCIQFTNLCLILAYVQVYLNNNRDITATKNKILYNPVTSLVHLLSFISMYGNL